MGFTLGRLASQCRGFACLRIGCSLGLHVLRPGASNLRWYGNGGAQLGGRSCAGTEEIIVVGRVTATFGVVVVFTVVTDVSDIATEDNIAESAPSTEGSNLPVHPCPHPLRLLRLR